MTNDELLRLAERVEKLAGPDREVDAMVFIATSWPSWRVQTDCDKFPDEVRPGRIQEDGSFVWGEAPAFTASLDAAMQLVPNQSEWGLYSPDTDAGESKFCCEISPAAAAWKAGRSAQASYAATPALAQTAAALRARAHSGDTQ